MTISLITRSNTVDEWRIQGNEEAIQLNLLETGEYTKSNGVLYFTGNSSLVMTSNGTSLSVSNNALIGGSLEIGDELLVGTDGTGSGNGQFFGTLQVRGPGQAFNVSNSAYITNNISIGKTTYTGNLIVNTSGQFLTDATVDGILRLDNDETALYVNTGSISVNTGIFTSNLISTNGYFDALYTDEITVQLITAAAAEILNAQIVSGNVYYLTSNTIYGYEGKIARFTSNVSANIVNLISDTANINAATILDLTSDNAIVSYANIETLLSNNSTLNTSVIGDATITNASVTDATITTLSGTDAEITNIVSDDINSQTGNIVSFISDTSTINVSTLLRTTITNADISTANVTSKVNVQNGSVLITRTSDNYDALVVAKGISRVKDTVVEGNLTVSGSFTQTGNINFEIDTFYLNANTGTNKDATIINRRPVGNNSVLLWNETTDRWEISTGNTWSTTYKILDGADIYTGVDSSSPTLVASASAVKTAYDAGVVTGGYANAAYRHANSAYVSQNTTGVYANTAYIHANAAFTKANTPSHVANSASSYANGAFAKANTANNLAQLAFDAANTAYVAGGTIAGAYANAAFAKANAAWSGTTGTHANSAYFTANAAIIAAAVADQRAVTSGVYANTAYLHANSAFANQNNTFLHANAAYTHVNSAFGVANSKLSLTGGTISGDLTVTGSFQAAGASIYANELKVADAVITLNSDIGQDSGNPNSIPTENAGLEVDRGRSANAYVIWNELDREWQATDSTGTLYKVLLDDGTFESGTDITNGGTVSGGELKLTYDIEAASVDSAVNKDYVDRQLEAFEELINDNVEDALEAFVFDATKIEGIIPTAALGNGTETYAINIGGTAARAAAVQNGVLTSAAFSGTVTLYIRNSSGTILKTIRSPGS
jgi:hypothetical protein